MSKIALGRGLSSLIPQKSLLPNKQDKQAAKKNIKTGVQPNTQNGGSEILDVDVEKISKNPAQMRKSFSKEALKELAESIKTHGVIQPLVVSAQKHSSGDKYQLIAGERRLEAAKIAGLTKVPAIVRKSDGQENLELALVENIQRENLNPIEEAEAYKKLQDEFNLTQEEIAVRTGKSRSRVANFLRLLSLPLEIQKAISENRVSEGHGRAILSLTNPEKQRGLFAEILKSNLTVRQAEEKVKLVSVSGHTRKIGRQKSTWSETEETLSDFLSVKVEIKKSGRGARISINCSTKEDVDKVVGKILEKVV